MSVTYTIGTATVWLSNRTTNRLELCIEGDYNAQAIEWDSTNSRDGKISDIAARLRRDPEITTSVSSQMAKTCEVQKKLSENY